MEKKLQFKVTTLKGSGIWTGSSNHMRMAALQGTSFLGGMRFWTEALLRSFGHRVCDCVDSKKGKEVFDVKAPEKICAACHSFGCTGLARAFRLHVLPVKPTTCEPQEKYIFSIPSRDRTVHYALAKGWEGELALSLSSNRPLSWPLSLWKKGVVSLPPEVVLATFLMLEYGTLGALDQYGCGLVHLTNREDLLPFLREALPESGREKPERGLADLRDFYFFKGAFDPDTLRRLSPGGIRLQNGRPGERPLARFEHIIRLRLLQGAFQTGKGTAPEGRCPEDGAGQGLFSGFWCWRTGRYGNCPRSSDPGSLLPGRPAKQGRTRLGADAGAG